MAFDDAPKDGDELDQFSLRGSARPGGADEEEDDADDEGAEERASAELAGRRLQLIPHHVPNVFRYEFGPAILAQVLEKLEPLAPVPLATVTTEIARYPGFYQLLREISPDAAPKPVYVGRTIRPVAARLREHIKKLQGRVPLDEMFCRFLFVEDLSLVGLSEDTLIAYFHPMGLDDWGKMGFGSKATGHGRGAQESEWHVAFPPDLTYPVRAGDRRVRTFRQFIAQVARGAPITVSIPRKQQRQFDADHPQSMVVPDATRAFQDWIADIEQQLGPRWAVIRRPMAWYIEIK